MPKCIKHTTKKYTSRNSPPFGASECKNKRRKGNNGKFWISKRMSNGVYRWFPLASKTVKKRKMTGGGEYEDNWRPYGSEEQKLIKHTAPKFKVGDRVTTLEKGVQYDGTVIDIPEDNTVVVYDNDQEEKYYEGKWSLASNCECHVDDPHSGSVWFEANNDRKFFVAFDKPAGHIDLMFEQSLNKLEKHTAPKFKVGDRVTTLDKGVQYNGTVIDIPEDNTVIVYDNDLKEKYKEGKWALTNDCECHVDDPHSGSVWFDADNERKFFVAFDKPAGHIDLMFERDLNKIE